MEIEEVWEKFGNQLRRFIAARVSSSDTADELTQQLLIKIYQNLDTLKESERIDGWLFRIARNLVHDYYRQQQKVSSDSIVDVDELAEVLEEKSAAEAMREELGLCVRPLIDQLPAHYRRTLIAVDLDGKSQKELADELGVNYSTIKSQSQRGRAQLRKLLKRCCDYTVDARGSVISYQPKVSQCDVDCFCNEEC